MKNFTLLLILCFTLFRFSLSLAQSVGDYNVYYGHLHNHTSYSDGTGTPVDAYTHGRDIAGLDFMGLSEHGIQMSNSEWNRLKNTANEYTETGRFVAFWGFEWSSNLLYGHVSVFNTNNLVNVLNTFSFSDLKKWLDGQDGVAFFNHPGREDNGVEFEHFNTAPHDKFVGMELWNKGRGFEEYYYNDGYELDDEGLSYFDEALTRNWKIGASGSHDHHGTSWGETDMAMAILAPELSREALYSALQAKRFYSTEDRSLVLSFQLGGEEMGSTLVEEANQLIRVRAFDEEDEKISAVQLYRNGLLFYEWAPNTTSVDLTKEITTSENEYYYVKITQEDGDEAISSPVFIEGNNSNNAPQVKLISPEKDAIYSKNASIHLLAEASDNDGLIAKVEFYDGDKKIGEDNNRPYEFEWNNVSIGNHFVTARAFDDRGLSKASLLSKIKVKQEAQIQLTAQISSGKDDAEEGWSTVVYNNSSDLELVYDDWLTGNQTIGLRFNQIGIPNGAEILNAYVQFTTDETSSESTQVTVKGEKSGSPQPFEGENRISTRAVTSAQVTWAIPAWNVVGESGDKQRTPDLSAVLQEIISLEDWRFNNSMALILNGKGKRIAESYEGDASGAAKLFVTYTNSPQNTMEFVQRESSQVELFPNPVINTFTIQSEADELQISAFDYTQHQVDFDLEKTESGYIIDATHWERGMYVVKVQGADGITIFRVLKK
ncbi:CehA/McbA family metallohydrolase [Fulvivirga sediminis]|uniref:CehA/McbA family metallohydrolase n=1 Tax=Fulvivirga sediminis TaxID=2803949 RepID=A0A937F786_9BACT|nr:CehA/McbA family metallohydrolase [Fulvivirga sediminis]MBL3655605.1 CehA/McbA family metallohydrolase [Fulvivirga sediminis]